MRAAGARSGIDFPRRTGRPKPPHHPVTFSGLGQPAHYSRAFSSARTLGDARGPGVRTEAERQRQLRSAGERSHARLGHASPRDGLRVVYVDQNRGLDPVSRCARALAPDSDRGDFIRVASFLSHRGRARFLFSSENLNQRVGDGFPAVSERAFDCSTHVQPAGRAAV